MIDYIYTIGGENEAVPEEMYLSLDNAKLALTSLGYERVPMAAFDGEGGDFDANGKPTYRRVRDASFDFIWGDKAPHGVHEYAHIERRALADKRLHTVLAQRVA